MYMYISSGKMSTIIVQFVIQHPLCKQFNLFRKQTKPVMNKVYTIITGVDPAWNYGRG